MPGISLVKTERIGTGSFVAGPVSGTVGQKVDYNLAVTNTGTATLSVTMVDTGCDTTPLPLGAQQLAPGASITFTCSHTLKASDGTTFTNVAVTTGTAPNGAQVTATSNAVATVAQGAVLGTKKKVAAKKKAVVKHKVVKKKVKKVTKKAKPARAVVGGAHFTG